ncbi:MAG: hypothetical protein CL912_33730 [Deltaproteobacteria bacterium]|nr:hypothetical protein [Deltaproteobacteria bacterium]
MLRVKGGSPAQEVVRIDLSNRVIVKSKCNHIELSILAFFQFSVLRAFNDDHPRSHTKWSPATGKL